MKRVLITTVLGLSMFFGFSAVALAATSGSGVPADGTYPGSTTYSALQLVTDESTDNGVGNVNRTGLSAGTNDGSKVGDVIKSDGMSMNIGNSSGQTNQRTHGEYQNNTNSCASCHQTHTAAAENLLFKDSVYNTCTACHDGTLGFYNVFSPSTAGTFSGTANGNASMHLPDGTMQISAAPGGNYNAQKLADNTTGGEWSESFNCASCHEPHGSYSDRLLTYSPNGIANVSYVDANGKATGGTKVSTTTIYKVGVKDASGNAIPDVNLPDASLATSPTYVVLMTTAQNAILGSNKIAGLTNEEVIVVMKKTQDGTTKAWSYQRDLVPWVETHEYDANHNKSEWTGFKKSATAYGTYTINYAQAYATGTNADLAVLIKADIARAVVVRLEKTNNVKDFGGIKITQIDVNSYDNVAGLGVQISQFCAGCHTDYLANSGSETGVWSKAFRHTTTSDSYSCLKCHFAHGTDVTVMLDARDQDVNDIAAKIGGDVTAAMKAAKDYMVDKNPSSALKRYTNMAVCWKCHTSSHNAGLANNEWVKGDILYGTGSQEYTTPNAYSATNTSTVTNGWKKGGIVNSELPYYQTPDSGVNP